MVTNRKPVVIYILGEIASLAGMGALLFWPAGRLDWWPAWGALAISAAWLTGMGLIIIRLHPALLIERLFPPKDAKHWDTGINLAIRLVTVARYIMAGLDQRYGWTGGFAPAIQVAALIACALGYGLFLWATASNAFFSQIVRIQSERGHTVASSGPYHYVRHPAYLGGMMYEIGVSIALASWWAILLSGLSASLLVLRTVLEDRTLQSELNGYQDYTRQVRYRLIPGIW